MFAGDPNYYGPSTLQVCVKILRGQLYPLHGNVVLNTSTSSVGSDEPAQWADSLES